MTRIFNDPSDFAEEALAGGGSGRYPAFAGKVKVLTDFEGC